MRIIFMGTPEFAVGTLQACIKNHEVVGVFTQPDKPKGRGKKMAKPPVKKVAESFEIPVFQPEKIRKEDWPSQIKNLNPDVIVVVAYGQILSQEILDIPRYGCINVHASLLPRYRGAAPINWAIAEGETVTGVTTMHMDVGLDTGDMLLKKTVDITPEMTANELHDLLATEGSILLIQTLDALEADTAVRTKQDSDETCYASMLNKDIARIDWNMSSKVIVNRIRAFNPWPVAHTVLDGVSLKIFSAKVTSSIDIIEDEIDANTTSGTVIKADKKGLLIKTNDGTILVNEIQLGSQKRMMVSSFLLGHNINSGQTLGK